MLQLLKYVVDPMVLGTVFVALVASILQTYFTRKEKFLRRFPGPTRFPLIGNALDLYTPSKVLSTLTKWEKEYGPRFAFSFGVGLELVSVSTGPDLEKVLTSTDLIDKSVMYGILKPWLGEGLLTSGGKKWHSRRKMLTPAFHFKILEQFQRVFDAKTKELVNVIAKKVAKGETVIEMHSMFTKCTLDVICETAMGKELNCLNESENAFLNATLRESALLWVRWVSPWLSPDLLWKLSSTGREEIAMRKVLGDFTNQVIQERKEQFLEKHIQGDSSDDRKTNLDDENIYLSSKKKVAFLDLLLYEQSRNPESLSDQDIQEETATFMFEGHDTTASAITWATYLLGLHEDHQEKVIEELDQVFGDDTAREIASTDLSKLKYLEMCTKESMRLCPTVPLISRGAAADIELDSGLVIPKGAIVLPNIYLALHREDVFPDPFEYRPERFTPENIRQRHPYAYVPFSAGPRNCIGQKFAYNEVKTTLANILRNFRIKTVSPKWEDLQMIPELVLRPEGGAHIQFTPRK